MQGSIRHLISVGLLALTTVGAAQGVPTAGTPTAGEATFTILLHGVRLGTESVSMTRVSEGWRVVSTGHQNAPIDLQNARFDMTYGDDWAPKHLTLDALLHGQPVRLSSTFSATSATNDVTSNAKTGTFTQPITAGTVVLPNSFYGAYEALAVRLSTMKVGDAVPLYVAPDGEVTAQVRMITPRRIATPNARLDFREFELTVATSVSQPIQIWIDDHSRLARVILPAAAITVARSDLATVMAREELVSNSGDASTFIPILGFTAGATVTTPTGATGRHPAVVLVPGFGPQDRDESVDGVPVFGLLAGAIADAGNLVVRYDRRGIGQSGGRPENATLEDYRDDLLEVIKWVRQRKDVDADRVAVIGYGDGGAIAMLAAQKEDAIKGLGLIAVPGSPGRDYVLEQQTLALAGMHLSEADRAAKIDLEHRLIDSALTGKGWETLPPDLSHGADQPIFKSWLLFNPTVTLKKVNQPVLILQGLADAELPRAHADQLAAAAQARKRPPQATTVALVPDVAHALTPAVGMTVGPATLSTEVDAAVTHWLHTLFTPAK
jgi:pimeloyl-ACP methyl ester carboxylesterase